jgi:DNA-binding GntR family transcriptional regulator
VAPSVAADMELHAELVRAAGNARISALFANLRDQIQIFAGFGNRTPNGPRRFLEIHLRIVELLLKRNVAEATRLMSEHMQLAKQQALRGYFGSEDVHSESGDLDH